MTNTDKAVSEVLEFYRRESNGPGPLWAGAARQIVAIVEASTPEEARDRLRKIARGCRKMSVSASYAGAANTLARGISADKRVQRAATKRP